MGAHKSWELNVVAAFTTSISFLRSQIIDELSVFVLFKFIFSRHQRFGLGPHLLLFSNAICLFLLARPSRRTPCELCGSFVGPAQTFQFQPYVIIAQMWQDKQFVEHMFVRKAKPWVKQKKPRKWIARSQQWNPSKKVLF